MPSLLSLPFRAAELAIAPPRFAVKTLLRFLRDDADSPRSEAAAPAPPPPRPRPEARAPAPPRRPEPPSPSPEAARDTGPGPEIHVAEPWAGFETMSEEAVLDRLIGADAGLRAAVRLYEARNANRPQVLIATEEPLPQP